MAKHLEPTEMDHEFREDCSSNHSSMPTLVNCIQPQENCSVMIRLITGQKPTHNELIFPFWLNYPENQRVPTFMFYNAVFPVAQGMECLGYIGVRTGLSCVTSHTPTRA